MLALAVVAALAAAVAEAEPKRGGGGDRPARSLLKRLDLGSGLVNLTPGWGDVWANDYGRERLVRIDGRSGRVEARLALGRRLVLAADGESLWALRWGGRFWRQPNGPLYRIDPRTNRVAARIPLRPPSGEPMAAFGVLAGGGDVWVWGAEGVLRLDADTRTVREELRVDRRDGELSGAILDGDGLLAVTSGGRLVRFCDRGRRPGPRLPELAAADLLATDGERVYAAAAGALTAVDAREGTLAWRRPLGFRVSTLLRTRGVLLAQGAAFGDPGDRLWALDPRTGELLASTTLPSFGTTSAALSGGSLWIATGAGEVIVVPRLLTRLFLAPSYTHDA